MTRFLSFAFTLLLSATLAGDASALPEKEAIIYGVSLDPAGSPVVELILVLPNGSTATCTGTAIGKRTILTAGHCVTKIRRMVAVFGGRTKIKAKSWWRHPKYAELRSGKMRNDIGIVRLEKDIPRGTPRVALSNNLIRQGETIYIYGYGVTEYDTVDDLRGGVMQVYSSSSSEFSGFLDYGGSLTCTGDSGGPAVRIVETASGEKAEIVGVISSGDVGCSIVSFFSPIPPSSVRSFIKKYLK